MVAVNHQSHQVVHVPAADPQDVTVAHVPVANTAVPGRAVPVPEATEVARVHTTVVHVLVPALIIPEVVPVQEVTRAIGADIDAVVAVSEEDTTIGGRITSPVSKIQGIINVEEVGVVIITVIRDTTTVISVVDVVDRTITTVEVVVDQGVDSRGAVTAILEIAGMIGVGHVIAAVRTVAAGRGNQKIP